MIKKTVQDINEYVGTTVNPLNSPDTMYELYSVPSYDTDYPEVLLGSEIGSSKVTVEENDVLVCKINPRINRVWVVKHRTEHQLIASSEWVIIRSPENDARYLRYYFQSPTFRTYINSGLTGIGGSLTRAQPKQIAKYPVPIPDIEIQHDIADTLDKLQSIIAHRKQQLEKLDQLVKARFVEMFGDPVDNPMKWTVKPVTDECSCMVPGRDKPKSFTGDIPWITIEDLSVCGTTYKSRCDLGLTVDEIKQVNRKVIPVDSVIMSCVGNLGICSIAGREMIINQQLHSFQCGCNLNNVYLMYNLTFRKDYMNKWASNTTVLYMNKTVCNSIPIMIPPIDLQNQFATFVAQTDKSKFDD